MIFNEVFLSNLLLLFVAGTVSSQLINGTNFTHNSTRSSLVTTSLKQNLTTKVNDQKSTSTTTKLTSSTSSIDLSRTKESLIDQFNAFRWTDIFSQIKTCRPDLKLDEICENYSLDNQTKQLQRSSLSPFSTLTNVVSSLIDINVVENLRKLCQPGVWCAANLTETLIERPIRILRQENRALCHLDRCQNRISNYTETCPNVLTRNISLPTVNLLPVLCLLSEEQNQWAQSSCARSFAYLFHLFYAFWPQFENCRTRLINGSDLCSSDCRPFIDIFDKIQLGCSLREPFSNRNSTWKSFFALKEICDSRNISSIPTFIYSVQKFFTSNSVWDKIYEKPIYKLSVVLIVISSVISLSLCFHVRSRKNNRKPTSLPFTDNFEYTRLHDSSFELGPTTEIPNATLDSSQLMDDSNSEPLDSISISEFQRFLY